MQKSSWLVQNDQAKANEVFVTLWNPQIYHELQRAVVSSQSKADDSLSDVSLGEIIAAIMVQ